MIAVNQYSKYLLCYSYTHLGLFQQWFYHTKGSKLIIFNMVVVKQTLTITTHFERVEIKNCWWLVIKVFAVLGWGTIISGVALNKQVEWSTRSLDWLRNSFPVFVLPCQYVNKFIQHVKWWKTCILFSYVYEYNFDTNKNKNFNNLWLSLSLKFGVKW